MASGIFAILDDIALLMDDVAVASKVATQKTAGILGDDLAVNAEKATGFLSSRELPVLWSITKGSFLNKIIIVPIALLLNYFFPIVITYILIAGGIYLAYEGAEKIIEFLFHRQHKPQKASEAIDKYDPELEKTKIRSAVTTDFILSIEIVIIALGAVLDRPLTVQILAVIFVAFLATVGVYGLVALIVRMDDVGYKFIKHSENKGFLFALGKLLVKLLPIIIKSLSVIGTIALILVAGGIFTHNIGYFHDLLPNIPSMAKDAGIAFIIGSVAVAVVTAVKKILPAKASD